MLLDNISFFYNSKYCCLKYYFLQKNKSSNTGGVFEASSDCREKNCFNLRLVLTPTGTKQCSLSREYLFNFDSILCGLLNLMENSCNYNGAISYDLPKTQKIDF